MAQKLKSLVLTLLATASLPLALQASTAIPVADVPEAVNQVIQEYFPDAKLMSAEKDIDEGKTEYEVKVQYKEIVLDVEVSPEGTILDVGMDN